MAKIALIVGSVRRDRQGIKVAQWMDKKLKGRNHEVFFVDVRVRSSSTMDARVVAPYFKPRKSLPNTKSTHSIEDPCAVGSDVMLAIQ